jgi:perosamine synthetase
MIPLTRPSIGEDDQTAVREVLDSGYLVQGPKVAEFERRLGEETETSHVIAVSNGTAALHLSLLALGIGAGDLVLVTAYSWLATANVIELCGAQPVFVDIQPDSFNMDPNALAERAAVLMSNRETARRLKAIVPIHAFGLMAEMEAINQVASRYYLPVIEDAACALGARRAGRPAGSCATMGTFSFHPRKAITTGEGGAVATGDNQLAWRVRVLRNHGLDPLAAAPDFVMPGFNYRLTEVQGALGISQMNKLHRIVARRRELAANYGRLLAGTGITAPAVDAQSEPVYQSYVCLLPKEVAPRRTEMISGLRERGIETTIGTWHMPMTTYFRTRYGFRSGDFPVADDVFARSLSLPLYETLNQGQQEQTVSALLEALA